MKQKPVVPRERATRDVEEAVDWCVEQDAADVARDFLQAVEAAFTQLSRHPGSGSPRLAFELGLEGLRSWPLKAFPYLVFYVERPDHLDVWRVLHQQRDLPSWLDSPDEPR